jgi:hypothetical protein
MNNLAVSVVNLFSQYDYFKIVVNDQYEFKATAILEHIPGFLEFERLFASAVISDDVITGFEMIEQMECVCNTPTRTYKIIALHCKPKDDVKLKVEGWNDIFDFMNPQYFNPEKIQYNEEKHLATCVVDPYRLGGLSYRQKKKIESIINANLRGQNINQQFCRTIYFQTNLQDEQRKIYAGIFNLENGEITATRLIHENYMEEIESERVARRCNEFLSFISVNAITS